jgi:peptidoglycan/LPS O-acetylase OafA/YrhL
MKSAKPVHFSGLNTLRFVAAFAIIIYHSTLSFQDSLPASVELFLHNLPIGVDLFFIISGFLIVFLLLTEKANTETVSLAKFYARRVLRIFPLYFLIVGIAYLQYHRSNPEIDFSKFCYFWGNFWMIDTNKWTVSILNPLWSLCIEEHFYLIIPVLIFIIPIKKIKYLFWAVIAISILFRAYAASAVEYSWMTLYLHTLSRCDLLALGGLLAHYYHTTGTRYNIKPKYLFGAVIYLALLMCMIDFNDFTTLSFALFKKYLFVLPLLIIFVGLVLNKNQSTSLLLLRQNKTINYLGKISYGLYMFHSPAINLLTGLEQINNSILLKPLAVTLLTIVLSAVSYELFEKQLLKLKTRFTVVKTQNS